MKKGYKVLDLGMRPIYGDRNMIYELNKVYEMPETSLEICEIGYHYYKRLEGIVHLYRFDTSKNRIFEVEILGEEITDDDIKYCTNKIKLVKELNQEEVDQYIEDHLEDWLENGDVDIKEVLIRRGYGLDTLVHDENWIVRVMMAHRGQCLDMLVHDKDPYVRLEVVKRGYGLDILVNDENWMVRYEVAASAHGLDQLIHDENLAVRQMAMNVKAFFKDISEIVGE